MLLLGEASLLEWLEQADAWLRTTAAERPLSAYAVLFIVVFLETGVLLAAFLPGDTILLAAGALAAQGLLNIGWLWVLLTLATTGGDATNYLLGRYAVRPLVARGLIDARRLRLAERLVRRRGGPIVFFGRFVPILRMMTPLAAGALRMPWRTFIPYITAAGALWTAGLLGVAFALGRLPGLRENVLLAVGAGVLMLALPAVWAQWRRQRLAGAKRLRPRN